MKRSSAPPVACLLATLATLAATAAAAGPAEPASPSGVTGTFSIVTVDPASGVCGAAVASRYPAVGKVVPYVRAGVGAFCTQHWHEPGWGPRAIDLLASGKLPEEVLSHLLCDDPRRDKRQLAVTDMRGRAANRNLSALGGVPRPLRRAASRRRARTQAHDL